MSGRPALFSLLPDGRFLTPRFARLYRLAPLLAALLPLLPLLNPWAQFWGDWTNHLWLIAYFGEYLLQHGSFPVMINTNQLIGAPIPVFYGILFYPIAGLVSTVTGANLAIRLLAAGLLLLQTFQVMRAVDAAGGSRSLALMIALLVNTAVYPLTNLYNRSAISEFVAVSLLISALCCWFPLLLQRDQPPAWPNALTAGLLLTLSAGTHPITATFGVPLFAVLVVVAFCVNPYRVRLLGMMAATGGFTLAILAPWLCVVARYREQLTISRLVPGVAFYPGLDSFHVRFSPLPYSALDQLGATPHLDAQINFPLLILVAYLLYEVTFGICQRAIMLPAWYRLAVASMLGFVFVSWASISPVVLQWLPSIFSSVQFAYRLVAYQDLLLLFASIFLLAALRPHLTVLSSRLRICGAACVLLSVASLAVKIAHAWESHASHSPPSFRFAGPGHSLLESPVTFYGWKDYALVATRESNPCTGTAKQPVKLRARRDSAFGEVAAATVNVVERSCLVTNVQQFPWNQLLWNGRPAAVSQSGAADNLSFEADSPGGTLEYVLTPDPDWLVLRSISFAVLGGLVGLVLILNRAPGLRWLGAGGITSRTLIRTATMGAGVLLAVVLVRYVRLGLASEPPAAAHVLIPPSATVAARGMQQFEISGASTKFREYRWSVDPPLAAITVDGLLVAPAGKPQLEAGAIAIEPGLASFGPRQVTHFTAIAKGSAEVRVHATRIDDAGNSTSGTVLLSEVERRIPVDWALDPPGRGTIDGTGTYMAPSEIPGRQSVDIIAHSKDTPARSARLTVALGSFVPVRVNAGGLNVTAKNGTRWHADTGYDSGDIFSSDHNIEGTDTPALYQTERWSDRTLSYRFPAPPGVYRITLKFAEIYFVEAGRRIFHVDVDDRRVLSNFDVIREAGGPFRALERNFTVRHWGQDIVISFIPETSAVKVNAIEISR